MIIDILRTGTGTDTGTCTAITTTFTTFCRLWINAFMVVQLLRVLLGISFRVVATVRSHTISTSTSSTMIRSSACHDAGGDCGCGCG
jgi:hypothetical protein